MFLDTHQNLCLCASLLLGLNHVEVHFVVKVSVVRGTNGQIETEGMPLHHPNFVHHHGHAVKRWLSVEDDDISVDQVAFDL